MKKACYQHFVVLSKGGESLELTAIGVPAGYKRSELYSTR